MQIGKGEFEPAPSVSEARYKSLASAAHNFLVTVEPWMHHQSDFLKASVLDLKYELSLVLEDYQPGGIYHEPEAK